MKIFGHPLHIMLIHFPSALFPMDFVCSALGFYFGNTIFVNASYFAMIGGVTLGFLAIVTGLIDLIGIADKKPQLASKVLIHGSINTVVIIGYCILTFMAYKSYPLIINSLSILVVKACLIAIMIVGNYLGGNLILKDKIGIQN